MRVINSRNPCHVRSYVPYMCKGQCIVFPSNSASRLVDTVTWNLSTPSSAALSLMFYPMMSAASSYILPLKTSAQSLRSVVLNFELCIVKALLMYAILLYKALQLGIGTLCHSSFFFLPSGHQGPLLLWHSNLCMPQRFQIRDQIILVVMVLPILRIHHLPSCKELNMQLVGTLMPTNLLCINAVVNS